MVWDAGVVHPADTARGAVAEVVAQIPLDLGIVDGGFGSSLSVFQLVIVMPSYFTATSISLLLRVRAELRARRCFSFHATNIPYGTLRYDDIQRLSGSWPQERKY